MRDVKAVGIISKPKVPRAAAIVPGLVEWLRGRGIEVRCDEVTAAYAGTCRGLPRDEVADGIDLMVVLGGDGTLLAAARALHGREIPLFPVNLGGLGFLTAITTDEICPELERAFRNEHRIGKRRMLRCRVLRGESTIAGYEALNDVVLTKSSIARMIDLDAYVDNNFVTSYKADGLIVCTPTGSTAYSLSAGGPIIFPRVEAFCITPISPHTLTNRPVILPDTSIIEIVNKASDGEAYLTIDGQVGEPLHCDDRVVASRSPHVLQLIRPPKSMFFDVLRQKLKWGKR
jgi:NAD+ kinase